MIKKKKLCQKKLIGLIFVYNKKKLTIMSYMKELFIKNFEKVNFSSIIEFLEPKSLENLEKETFEVNKGDYKTIVNLYFDKKGYLIHTSSKISLVSSKIEEEIKNLEKLRDDAVSKKDFLAAHNFQKDIDYRKDLLNEA